jgi:16S rRNA (guanine1207-N2)-methyltransferase
VGPSGDGSHYFSSEPVSSTDRRVVPLVLPDVSLELETDSGVFAKEGVDVGTKLLLLDGPGPTDGDQVLVDLGAGYGPIACVLAARNPTAEVLAVEVNRRARELCRTNAERAGLPNVRVVAPDEVATDLVIDRIWSNPPIRVGKGVLHDMLSHWLGRLGPAGSAHLVVQKHLGADSLARWLANNGWSADRRGSKRGYRLLDVERRRDVSP